jgi:Major Facilitator Superfamily
VHRLHLSAAPADASPVQKRNFLNVQVDAVGVGLASAAAPFLPVFLARLGASNTDVGLLTAMPAFTGLFLAIIIGRFLQRRRQVVPWFSVARLLNISAYAMTGIVPFLVPREFAVTAVLVIWAAVTVPQTLSNVAFSVVMNAVAGPRGRYDLLSRRWSILGLTTALAVAIVGKVLDSIAFPLNYQVVFMCLSVGGLISYYFSNHISLPDTEPPTLTPGQSPGQRFEGFVSLIRSEKEFVSFTAKRLVYMTGTAVALPLVPLYYVREVQASDAWIGAITMTQTAVALLGYIFWTRQSRKRGSRFVLLATALGMALYPVLMALTHSLELMVVFAALSGIFQAGQDLVFFDELLKTVPAKYSATFVSLAQCLEYLSRVAAPIIGTMLADQAGLGAGLMLSGVLRLVGFGLFAWQPRVRPVLPSAVVAVQPSSGDASK